MKYILFLSLFLVGCHKNPYNQVNYGECTKDIGPVSKFGKIYGDGFYLTYTMNNKTIFNISNSDMEYDGRYKTKTPCPKLKINEYALIHVKHDPILIEEIKYLIHKNNKL